MMLTFLTFSCDFSMWFVNVWNNIFKCSSFLVDRKCRVQNSLLLYWTFHIWSKNLLLIKNVNKFCSIVLHVEFSSSHSRSSHMKMNFHACQEQISLWLCSLYVLCAASNSSLILNIHFIHTRVVWRKQELQNSNFWYFRLRVTEFFS
jgi:hypothetical protein